MASSSKKITYTNDFKLKVLDYYFKHGGDNNFGLKTKTALHFNIDKKTIQRMLKNPDMVKKARKLGAKKPILTSAKTGGKSISKTAKNLHRPGLNSKGSSSTGVSTSTTASKTSSGVSSTNSSGSMKHSSSAASSSSSGAKSGGQGNKAALSSGKSGPSGPGRPTKVGIDENVEVQVFDLPEDPDYSVLKHSINTSTSGVAGISKLLVTGTPEVQNMLLHECDIIMECKVCRNLFRSVANFLAHKRIYCRETYSDVRSLFHKGETEGVTNQSGTVIVVPEPPSKEAEIAESTSQHLSSVQSTSPPGINIASRLVGRQKPQELSSSTGKGTSKYFEKILEVNKKRNLISQDCSVVLEDIAGVTNARFQSYNSKDPSSKSIKCIVDQIQQKSLGLTVVLNEHGQITKTAPGNAEIDDIKEEFEEEEEEEEHHPPSLVCRICNTSFATRKTLSRHQRSFHEMERAVFSCPLCNNNFFSMWATVKHLQRFHRKSATYIQRVRNTIKERSRVKAFPRKLPKVKDRDQSDDVEEAEEEKGEEEDVGKDIPKLEPEENSEKENQAVDREKVEEKIDKVDTPRKDKEEVAKQNRPQSTPQSANGCAVSSDSTGMSATMDLGGGPVDSYCNNCERRFQTPLALSSHEKFCSLLQIRPDILPEGPLSPRLRAEQPKKKISIQIRKDYKKELSQEPLSSSVSESDSKGHMLFKVPKTPTGVDQLQKVDALISEFCNIDRLQCIPCDKRYHKVSSLRRHASLHFDWTRFVCVICGLRKYNKYELMFHCNQDHNMDNDQAESSIKELEAFGPLRYFLKADQDTPNTPTDMDSNSVTAGLRSRSTSLSSVTVSSIIDDSSLDRKEESGKEEVKSSNVVPSEDSSCLDGSPSDFTFLGWDTKDILREKPILHLRSRSEPNICRSSGISNENEDIRTERPHRARRFTKRKDFIYELKRSVVPRSECKTKEVPRYSEECVKNKVNKRLSSSPAPSNICKKTKQEIGVANDTLYTETPVKIKSHSLQSASAAALYQNGVDKNVECMTIKEDKIPLVDTCVNTYRKETTEIKKENTSDIDCVLDNCNGDKESPQSKIASVVVSNKASSIKDAHRLVWIDVDDKQNEDKEIGKSEPMALQLAIKESQ